MVPGGQVLFSLNGDNGASNRLFQRLDQIGFLPAEATLFVGLTAEMTIGGGALINRFVQAEMRANAARSEIHHVAQGGFDLGIARLAGAVGVDKDRLRLGNADGIGKLKRAASRHACGDDILGR